MPMPAIRPAAPRGERCCGNNPCSPSSVAGKGHRMAIVVRGVVHGLDVGEADAADDEEAEQAGERGTARAAVNSAVLSAAPGCLVDKVVMIFPSALRPRAVKVARHRPVSWLAGLSVPSAFPERMAPVASGKGSSPLTVAGAAAASSFRSSPRSRLASRVVRGNRRRSKL